MSGRIHSTSVIDAGACLAGGVEVGPFAVIEADTVIGEGCSIGAHAVVKRFTHMGTRNRLAEGAVLGGLPQDLRFGGAESRLVIGDDNVFREHVTVHRATGEGVRTRIGSRCFLMVGAHVAHDCLLADGVILANNVALAGHVEIEADAFLSGGVAVHQFCRVGRLSMVGGNAKVERDVLPFTLVDGVPARTRTLNLVGLRRTGIGADELRMLKRALRLLLGRDLTGVERLARLKELGQSEAVSHLRSFLEGSERGYCRGV